jgi:hypothetical protein
MKFADLVSSVEVFGGKGSDTLIIMPAYQEYGFISGHLEALGRQTCRDFDLVIILNRVSDEKKVYGIIEKVNPGFRVIVAKRKEDTGSAGGFFTGQRYALENGYQQAIFADVDCMPVSSDLVETLLSNKDREFVKPTVRMIENDVVTQTITESVIPYYALLSVGLMRRKGLYYMPLYYGAEDLEYNARLGKKPYTIDRLCQHRPAAILSYKNMDKSMIYQVNGMAVARSMDLKSMLIYLVTLVATLPAHMIFFPPYGRRASLKTLHCLLTHTYGKAAKERLVSGFRESVLEGAPEGFRHVEYTSAVSKDRQYWKMPFRIMMDTLRKNVAIDYCRSGFLAMAAAVFARKTVYRIDEGKYLTLSDNGGMPAHLLKAALFLAALPLSAAFVVLYVFPINLILGPDTRNYGLD